MPFPGGAGVLFAAIVSHFQAGHTIINEALIPFFIKAFL